MSTWSVDGIHNFKSDDGRALQVMRFVHYVDDPAKPCGLRYLIADQGREEELQWGQAYYFDAKQLRSLRQLNQTPYLESQFRLEPAEHIERELRSDGAAAFSRAGDRSRRDGNDDRPNAQPARISSRAPHVWARIHVHNVGQGDTIVLELGDKELWLVDARLFRDKRKAEFDAWMQATFPGKSRFDKVVVTHLHYDHIESIPHILRNYEVGEVVVPDSLQHPTATARRVYHAAEDRLATVGEIRVRQFGELQVELIRTADVPAICQAVHASANPNDHEIAVLLRTNSSVAFLAGDMPGHFCHEVLAHSAIAPNADGLGRYYKVSHHGSRTGYDHRFFHAYPSRHSVISCGAGNRYKHPHPTPTDLFRPPPVITHRGRKRVYTYDLI